MSELNTQETPNPTAAENTVTPGKEVTTDEQNALQKFFTDLFSGKKPDETKEEKAKPDAKSN